MPYPSSENHRMVITGGTPLYGECAVGTSKNAVLPILAAALLTKEPVTIFDVPNISDVKNMVSMLKAFGSAVRICGSATTITSKTMRTTSPAESITGRFRASFLFIGPLLAREGSATMPLPGGCSIGSRPVDIHLNGFRALGCKCITTAAQVHVWGRPRGARIHLEFPSVGATENILMAAVLAKGITTITGAATEPEVIDLACFLNSMGAKITIGGNGSITISGVEELSGTSYTPIPDRIEAGTLMLAAAVSGGEVRLRRVNPQHLTPVCGKLSEAGAEIFPYEDGLSVKARRLLPMEIVSSPFPGFPTDMQAPITAACCGAKGTSTVCETVFENRFLHVAELAKMGADITVQGNLALIRGTGNLHGADVRATDLRAGAALCIAALIARGETVINDIHHIDRGYDRLENKLSSLGAKIRRI
ncbi:MAG: UDP-N-acetylglucosamine 1-carboxyvinyltransferase [Christensenellales bacterium]